MNKDWMYMIAYEFGTAASGTIGSHTFILENSTQKFVANIRASTHRKHVHRKKHQANRLLDVHQEPFYALDTTRCIYVQWLWQLMNPKIHIHIWYLIRII